MIKYLLVAVMALSLFSTLPAMANSECNCSDSCQKSCEMGKSEKCECKACDCKKGTCSHHKCGR